MSAKTRIIKMTDKEKIVEWARPVQVVLEGIEDAQQGLQVLYRLGRPNGFDILEALVDCNNHLHKACQIASQKLAQLSLPEPTKPEQPELLLGKEVE